MRLILLSDILNQESLRRMIVFKRIWGEIYYRLYYFLIKEMADDGDEGADTHTHTWATNFISVQLKKNYERRTE